jgi:hypothetical protein
MTGDKNIDTMYEYHLGRVIHLHDYLDELDSNSHDDYDEIQYVQNIINCIMAEIKEMYDYEFGESDDGFDIIHLNYISNST